MRVYNKQMFSNQPRMNTTLNSLAMEVNSIYGFAIQAVYTGTPTGSLKLQASCDPLNSAANYVPTNWTDISGTTQAISAAGNFMWNVNGCFYNYVRLVYTDGSSGASTAVLTVCTINSKGV